jgi:nitrous oxidase accessory protein NosD
MGKSGKLQHVASLLKVNAPAEIIQLNYTLGRTENETALDILDIFIDSEPHKKIIESNYKDISVGVFITSEDDIWVTVRFY